VIKPSLTLSNNLILVNLLGFNAIWFGLILLGNVFIPIAVIMLLLHLYYQADKNELVLILIVAGVGVLLDSALIYSGIFIFPGSTPTQLPFWLITLWLCFSATVRHSLGFLANSKILQCLIGAIFAPLSYLAGAKFSVVYITPSFELSYLLLAGLWGPLMVLVFALSAWLQIEEKNHVAQL
tara:strand:- start:2529 stop:3071 length:543 start_codon:yes stop_codon:yes gene_type:complete